MARSMYVEGDQVSITQNSAGSETEFPNRMRERFRIRFEKGNSTLAGFFKFVPQAMVTDGVDYNTTSVTAAYIASGRHMAVFIGYPYFGNNTLEHDPSLGLENVVPWLPTSLLMVLIGATVIIIAAVAAVRLRKKPINIVNIQ
jgi:hypothetical protein